MSLQTIVDEILLKQEGRKVKRIADKSRVRTITPFLTRQKSLLNAEYAAKASSSAMSRRTSSSNGGEIGGYDRQDLVENDEFITNDDLWHVEKNKKKTQFIIFKLFKIEKTNICKLKFLIPIFLFFFFIK